MLAGGAALALLLLALIWIDEGEVATLTALDRGGREKATEHFIVDVGGTAYVRASAADAHWVERLRQHPEVRLRRGDTTLLVRAVPIDDLWTSNAVDSAILAKYGLLHRVLFWLVESGNPVPVRLEPITAATGLP
jgi:hypothetical protein